MANRDCLLWHQCIVGYCLHADKELVAKVSQDAKERQLSTLKQGADVPDRSIPTKLGEPGESSKKLAKIAGTGPAPLPWTGAVEGSKEQAKKIAEQMIPLEEKIKLEEEARAAEYAGRPKKEPGAPESPGSNESKKIAVKIAEKAGVSPRTV